MNSEKAVVFDLDDTLIDSNYKYLGANIEACRVIFRALGTQAPAPEAILSKQFLLDREAVEAAPVGEKFSADRFPRAWVQTYLHFAALLGLPVSENICDDVFSAANRALIPPYRLVPGAVAALREIQRAGYTMIMLTIGAEHVQRRKIARTGLARFFDEVWIEPAGKEAALTAIGFMHASGAVMAGNSMRSDINPAIRAKLQAVHIPRSTWRREAEEPAGAYHLCPSIRELPALLRTILTPTA